MKDDLGDRIKNQYEDRTRYSLPRRTYTIIRLDGKAFHTYTRGLQKPFDKDLSSDMDNAIISIMSEIQGAQFAYVQSDEISILLIDFATPQTSAWFDGNLQKICSVSASLITANFNKLRWQRRIISYGNIPDAKQWCFDSMAYFDARVFTIPDPTEVMNYFIWRNQDCSRNSVSMVAQSMFSHKELQGKSTSDMHEMMRTKGVNWATDYSDGDKNGRVIVKEEYERELTAHDGDGMERSESINRTRWVSQGAWKFTEDMQKLKDMIPHYE